MRKSETTRIVMATVPHATSGSGLRKFQADGFLLDRVYMDRAVITHVGIRQVRRQVAQCMCRYEKKNLAWRKSDLHLRNKNQLDALFFSSFYSSIILYMLRAYVLTIIGIYCIYIYIYKNWYVLCFLVDCCCQIYRDARSTKHKKIIYMLLSV